MVQTRRLSLSSLALALAAPLAAQITYVDADENSNTTLADGSALVPVTANVNDDQWRTRAFGNGLTVLTSNEAGGTGEDAPMLRTRISGLIPTLPYTIYAYFWNADNGAWRGRADVAASQPAGPLPGYNGSHFAGSAFAPATSLSVATPTYNGLNPRLDLSSDPATFFENEGHFANNVVLTEGNRLLFEVQIGRFTADLNGDIDVYIDDLELQSSDFNRTWYDGVGYEMAPLPAFAGCGSPQPEIGHIGAPIYTQPFELTLANAPASSLAFTIVGLNGSVFNGVPLPFDLGLIGFTSGCPLNVSADLIISTTTDASGNASFAAAFPIVASPVFVYWQWGVLTPTELRMSSRLDTLFHR
ncbi:MAG: hypothetical protein AB8H80_19625 [Planctomycetota bacterium]